MDRSRGSIGGAPRLARARLLALPVLLLLGAAGCTGHQETNDDLDTLIAEYRQRALEIEERNRAAEGRGVERLEVRLDPEGGVPRVDLAVTSARLEVVVERLVAAAGLDLALGPVRLTSRTTARFEDRPLPEALDVLLAPEGLRASVEGGVVRVERGMPREAPGPDLAEGPDGGEPASSSAPTIVERPLRFARPDGVLDVLERLYPEDEDLGRRVVTFAARPETASIYLAGPADEVARASRLLDRLDTDGGHVLLEALVVEFNVQSFMDIGSRIAEGSRGSLTDIFFDVASLVGTTLSFTRTVDAAASTGFTAIIDLLIQREEARVISRPWLTTLSGIPAQLEIAEDRYVVTSVPGGFEVNLEEISSGVSMEIVPTVVADGSIRLELSITESQFIPSLENVGQRRSRNTVASTTQVGDGETVIIGGLMLKRRGRSQAGIPGLRNIFPFNLVLGHEDYSHTETQVMVYVTPYLWKPGIELPLPAAETFEIYPPSGGQGEQEEPGG